MDCNSDCQWQEPRGGASMNARSGGVEQARALVAGLWRNFAALLRFVCALWPCHNSSEHISLAQFHFEVERARRASGEKGGRA
jgi:hypothetical protein